MTTIPASQLVNVLPNVLSAGGSAFALNGLVLTTNTRVPVGQVLSFPNDGVSVSNYFGPSALETKIANTYFAGFDGSPLKPAQILFTQFTQGAVAAYLRGGNVSQMTLAQLQGLNGTLTVVMDGSARTGNSINLAAASSFSAVATIIQNALNASEPQEAQVTGAIAPETASFTASIAGNIMTVTAVSSGAIVPGEVLSGTGVTAGTEVTAQLSGAANGIGTYAVNIAQSVASETITGSYGLLTVSAVISGTLAVGQTLTGTGVTAGTQITGLNSGAGGTGTYYVQDAETVTSTTITASATALTVTYDSVSGGFVFTSGILGSPSTAAYATGSLAAPLDLTQATGAVLSQGAPAQLPGAFMTALVQANQNFASFFTATDPDLGQGSGSKQAFASWTNGENDRYVYIAADTDVSPTLSDDATSSFGNIVQALGYNGTCVIYDPELENLAAFVAGIAASLDFSAQNGRTTFAFRQQAGLIAGVTNATAAANLVANGYNFYGAYATASEEFIQFQPGSISGKFDWLDSFYNQIWLNQNLTLALMTLLQNTPSIPYNQAGYSIIRQACADPINEAVNFGAIRAGVALSSQQISEVNAAAGADISAVLFQQGWFLLVSDPGSTARQARTSPVMDLWYCDGESVQQITLNSVLIQ